MSLTIANAHQLLKVHSTTFKELFTYGDLTVEMYKPESVDLQQPHSRNEIYIIASGFGYFVNGDRRTV